MSNSPFNPGTPPGLNVSGESTDRARELEDTKAELERCQYRLEQLQMRYGAVLRSTPHGLCMLGCGWEVLYANHAMATILDPHGMRTTDLLSMSLGALFPSREGFEAYRESASKSVRHSGMDRRELELCHLDGTRFWCEISVVWQDPSATAGGYVATLTDITERKRTEAERRTMAQLSLDMVRVDSIEAMGKAIATAADTLFQWDAFAFFHRVPGTNLLRRVYQVDRADDLPTLNELGGNSQAATISLELFPLSEPVLAPWTRAQPRYHPWFGAPPRDEGCAMVVPIPSGPETSGAIAVQAYRTNAYDPSDAELMATMASIVNPGLGRLMAETEMKSLASFPQLLPSPVVEINASGRVQYLNPVAESLFPGLRDLGFSHGFLFRVFQGLPEIRENRGEPFFCEVRVENEWYEQVVHYVDSNRCFRVYGRNVSARKKAEQRLQFEALHDRLTRLPNRSLFLDRLDHLIARRGPSAEKSFAVMYFDLDNFKTINDSLGHTTGDLLLVELAGRIGGCLRPEDTVARLGGDEFGVLIESIQPPHTSDQIADRILGEVRIPFDVQGHEIQTTASLGIALAREEQASAPELLRDADTAMYEAKRRGKDRCVHFNPSMHTAAVQRLTREVDLRAALRRNEFVLYYQPVIELSSGRLVGFEALIRWFHPSKGLIPPESFIGIAEETGLILPLGQWVLSTACEQMREWQTRHRRRITLHVNLSVRQMADPDLGVSVERILTETRFPARDLNLEITESALLEYGPATSATIGRLKELGVRLSIDDFGTGFSCLGYLTQLPIDVLKIDRSFVARMTEDTRSLEIVRAIRQLARTFHMETIAEGTETADHRRILNQMGCEYSQGYHFSRPLEASAVETVLATGKTWNDR